MFDAAISLFLISKYHQTGSKIIKDDRVRQAMLATDRGFYAPTRPYDDTPQPIGYGQTISAPHMHASACDELISVIPEEGAKVLDVGCGSGYLTSGKLLILY